MQPTPVRRIEIIYYHYYCKILRYIILYISYNTAVSNVIDGDCFLY